MTANPDYFKVKGRERPGKAAIPELTKQELTKAQENARPAGKSKSNPAARKTLGRP